MHTSTSIVRSAVAAFVITGIGMAAWGGLLLANLTTSPAIPWAVPVMAAVLWGMWQYLGGRWAPARTSAARAACLRARPVTPRVLLWSLAANGFAIAALAGAWIVLFQLVPMRPNTLPDVSRYPPLTIVAILFMSSLVAPFVEEAAFRGYAQVPLEPVCGGAGAVAISSTLFALAHVTHGLLWPKLLVYFLAGLSFGTTAYLAGSLVPGIASHIVADLTFFTLVWPYDAGRSLFWRTADHSWFWVHAGQAIAFALLALLAFRRLRSVTSPAETPDQLISGRQRAASPRAAA